MSGPGSAAEVRPLLIGGRWVPAADVLEDRNPSDHDDLVGLYARGGEAEAQEALAAARAAFPRWRDLGPGGRSDALDAIGRALWERREEIGRLLAREEGKTLAEGIGEAGRAAQIFRFFAAEAMGPDGERWEGLAAQVEIETRREPIGVVGVIAPWNFPIAIPAWKIAPALAFGNTVVFKPAELVPASAWALAEVIHEAGLPDGAFNLVIGPGRTVGQTLATSDEVDALTFTGSSETGRRIIADAAARMLPVQVEMGGKNALVVLDDADLEVAVRCAVEGGWGSTGQRCTASSRIIVTRGIHDAFVDLLHSRLEALRVGHALDPETAMGPVVDGSQLRVDLDYLEIGRAEGAHLLTGGELVEREHPGHYLSPALFVDTTSGMRINQEEIFGPIASVIGVDDDDEALATANDSPWGLTGGVVTTSLARARHFSRHSATGMFMVNLPTAGVDYRVPFGGWKQSGFGPPEQGRAAREFFTRTKTAYSAPFAGVRNET